MPVETKTLAHPLSAGSPPRWASGWGEDEFGPWVEVTCGRATQRLRWILPGRFMMGSPEDEDGRSEGEVMREEMIGEGYWIFDTPCRQGMWEAVMGGDPSRFKGENRPVEQVSWEDCQEFLERLNAQIPGMNLELPSEVKWEYACRAGTQTARYAEDLDSIAWYEKNGGGESHDVATKLPNDWGLYDTLGNVYEWCEDRYKLQEGVGSAKRVIRGGSWRVDPLHVRAAYRRWSHPVYLSGNLGFRCSSSESEPGGGDSVAKSDRISTADTSQ